MSIIPNKKCVRHFLFQVSRVKLGDVTIIVCEVLRCISNKY